MKPNFFLQIIALVVLVLAVVIFWRAGPKDRKEARDQIADLASGCCLVLGLPLLILINLFLAACRLLH